MNKRKLGAKYEKVAAAFLEKQGYEVIKYNYRCFFGEIDLIAKDADMLVFCEVKYRKNASLGSALEAVNYHKQQIIVKCAMQYLMARYEKEIPCRFDVIGVQGTQICHIKNAYQG
ncbi:MAG: YraN family protein [Lachnospiraceae bacterium]|nr:YraN family protein [Lachnospiraceae bacterium]